jgi:hypothetical protein
MKLRSIHQQDGLHLGSERGKCHPKFVHNGTHQLCIVPCTLLPNQCEMAWAIPLQLRHVSHQKSVLVPDDDLRHILLIQRLVADESDMGQVCPASRPVHKLDRLTSTSFPLLASDDGSSACALEQTHSSLVHVDEKRLLAGRHFADQVVHPLPARESLGKTKCGHRRDQKA